MLNVYFWNKNEKMFLIGLNSDLKEEPDLKSRCYFTLFEPVMPGSLIFLNPNVGKYAPICVTLWICQSNSQSSKYVSICSYKVQNMHELLLSSV